MHSKATLRSAAQRAVRHLRSLAGPHGEFVDYALPVGASDEWTTAYVAVALGEAARSGIAEAAHPAARAATWLRWLRHRDVGYGFNAHTGSDADSTAHALLALVAEGHPVEEGDRAFLRAHFLAEAKGFATYLPDAAEGAGWARAHGCVTPVAAAALEATGDRGLRSAVIEALTLACTASGFRGYWWRSDHYATWVSLRYLRSAGANPRPAVLAEAHARTSEFASALDLACIVGRELILHPDPDTHAQLLRALCDHQREDGSWPPGADLRVTDPDRLPEDPELRGACHVDARSTITTATCLRVLCDPVAAALW